ncbi:MAG: T9SS type A sorting domain-containing protein, partial [Raineya sp.]|nr:T9SS type A sorting domain-containing protein [Raineya sp.]
GMAILSEIFFSAENGSFFPYDALENINSPYYSLKNDFIHIFPSFIFDTHFIERGRNARLIGFLAKWYQQTGNLIKGIGVDDKTALCIDASKNATCYGTGAVHIYVPQSFSFPNNKIYTPDLKAHILLHGHQINLNTFTMLQEASTFVSPTVPQENGNYQVWLSGGEGLSENNTLLQDFVNSGSVSDNVLIVTGTDTTVAHQYRQNLRSKGASGAITILQTIAANNQSDKYQLRNAIRLSKKVLFVNITNFGSFFQFLNGGETGSLLNSHIRRNQILNLFIGENSKLAGKIYVTNNRANKFLAYDGNLSFSNGLALLNTTTILPNAFNPSDNDFYENNSCAVSYAVAKYRLKYGIYLNRTSFIKFYQQSGQNVMIAGGNYSAFVLINGNTRGGLATQIASTVTNQPRNIAGFSEVQYALLYGNHTLQVGTPVPSNDENYTLENPVVANVTSVLQPEILLYPNPARNFVKIEWKNAPLEVVVCDISGKWTSEKYRGEGSLQINTQFFQKGFYVVLIKNTQSGQILMKKLTIY